MNLQLLFQQTVQLSRTLLFPEMIAFSYSDFKNFVLKTPFLRLFIVAFAL